jgi:hypothetical protein
VVVGGGTQRVRNVSLSGELNIVLPSFFRTQSSTDREGPISALIVALMMRVSRAQSAEWRKVSV